ncbi:MAG: DNA-binding protein [Candidatus Bathyarchaeia archaeon]
MNQTNVDATSMTDDEDLNLIKRRRLLELQKRALLQQAQKTSSKEERPKQPEEVLKELLIERAWEVMEAAKIQYPQVADEVSKAIVTAWTTGRLREKITGEQLHWLFRSMGYPVRLRTQIRFIEDGEAKSIAEKLRG